MLNSLHRLRDADPARGLEAIKLVESPAFEALFSDIVATQQDHAESFSPRSPSVVPHSRSRRPKWLIAAAAVLVAIVAVTVAINLSAPPRIAMTTTWKTARVLASPAHHLQSGSNGSWQLVDDLIASGWQQNLAGPPPGDLTCPTTSACYAMSGSYSSPNAESPSSESLYVSADLGSSWSVLPMPSGFNATTSLSCGGALECDAGGTYEGQAVLVSTSSGGHQWTVNSLDGVSGDLLDVSCSSAIDCNAIAGPSWAESEPNISIGLRSGLEPNESFVTTTNAGTSWSSTPLASPSNDVVDFACADSQDCILVGMTAITQPYDAPSGFFVRVTDDGGTTWTSGSLPAGFGVDSPGVSRVSCSDAKHCALIGSIELVEPNPPQCASKLNNALAKVAAPAWELSPSPAVQAVAGPEAVISAKVNAEEGGSDCSPNGLYSASDIALTTDGGLTWVPQPIPAGVASPALEVISCASSQVCWAAGSAAVAPNAPSSLVIGTTDGGETWTKATFDTPPGASDFEGQSFLSIGTISCPSSSICVALGSAAPGSSSTPVYQYGASASQ
jgi:hypothetical protein